MKINSNIKGVLGVSFSNLLALLLSLVTSFVLPLFISVEQYGYWQLFVMYCGYVGFFAFGFNDGIHLNYAACNYDEEIQKKFGTFLRFIGLMSLVESILLLIIIPIVLSDKNEEFDILIVVVANIIPTTILGLFSYLNQCTLRFKYYSIANVVDKILFGVVLIGLLSFRIRSIMPYIISFTATRYIAILYHISTSKEVFTSNPLPFISLKKEIKKNFVDGFVLMIACILGGSTIIIGSRILVQRCFGIEAFSQYSFSLHTLVIAAQFINAIATVFYPIMKRCRGDELRQMYMSFDKVTTLLSSAILLSYFPAALLIFFLYPKYISILAYLFIVYPLFIYQCKSNVLVINIYKVRNKSLHLILVNLVGVILHCVFVLISYLLFNSIFAISVATLMSYCLWYYIYVINVYKKEGWELPHFVFGDLFFTVSFILLNVLIYHVFDDNLNRILIGFLVWVILLLTIYVLKQTRIKYVVYEFNKIMKEK